MIFPIQDLIFGSVALLVTIFYQNDIHQDQQEFLLNLPDYGLETQEYDFIIVGGGAAGSVVASNLAKHYSVILLEGGGPPFPQMSVPANAYSFALLPEVSYQWTSTSQTNCCHSNPESRITLTQGKVLGGSTSINGMHYNRGHPLDYNNWGKIANDSSWNYENILKYFQMIEDYGISDNDHLGFGGPFSVRTVDLVLNDEEKRRLDLWNKAGQELGYEANWETSNSPQKEGFGVISNSKRNNKRESAYTAFLENDLNNPNLHIMTYSVVEKIEFEGSKAVGVLYKKHGVNKYVRAKNEIIISAGTLNSPHILLKSGIGPQSELAQAQIPLKLDLPVGETFQDHPAVRTKFIIGNEDCIQESDLNESTINLYLKEGKGPLANAFPVYGEAFIVSDEAKNAGEGDWPDLQFTASCNSKSLYEGGNEIQILVVAERPLSVGTTRLDQTNPLEAPLIFNPNFLSHERDLKALVQGVKIVWAIAESQATAEIGVTLDRTKNSNCLQYDFASDAYWTCYVQHETWTNSHPVGTCPIGKVVDSELRVFGIDNLRIIDNSVQPMITNANTMSPALLIGQKGSDLLLTKWGRKENSGNGIRNNFGYVLLTVIFVLLFQ